MKLLSWIPTGAAALLIGLNVSNVYAALLIAILMATAVLTAKYL